MALKSTWKSLILDATHRNTLGARTLYSNIYDLKNAVVYLYYLHDFDNQVVIDLNEELKTMILSTYRDDKLIFAAMTSFAHPEALREFLYSLQFD